MRGSTQSIKQAYCDDGSLLSLHSRHRTNNETSYRVVARTASNSLEYFFSSCQSTGNGSCNGYVKCSLVGRYLVVSGFLAKQRSGNRKPFLFVSIYVKLYILSTLRVSRRENQKYVQFYPICSPECFQNNFLQIGCIYEKG